MYGWYICDSDLAKDNLLHALKVVLVNAKDLIAALGNTSGNIFPKTTLHNRG